MFKQLMTLTRGRSADAAQAMLDANALSLLRQQLREAAQGVEKSRRALAVVMAHAEREKAILEKTSARIEDLGARAIDALSQDKSDLANETAHAIAHLESEHAATAKTIDIYTTEITRLRALLSDNQTLLAELKRGQRLAVANDTALRLQGTMPRVQNSDLTDAAQTLERLQERQEHATATVAAMAELSASSNADALSDRLAAAGCGTAKHATAEAVLERLKQKQRHS